SSTATRSSRTKESGSMNRVWRTALAAAMIAAFLSAMAGRAPAKPAGRAGGRDASFGKDGKGTVGFPSESAGSSGPQYELPFEFTPGHQKMALEPGGKVVVEGASKTVRFLV